MRFPLGKKGFMGTGAALAGILVFLRIRSRKREEESREWEQEIAGAVDEGRSASEAGVSGAAAALPPSMLPHLRIYPTTAGWRRAPGSIPHRWD